MGQNLTKLYSALQNVSTNAKIQINVRKTYVKMVPQIASRLEAYLWLTWY